MSNLALCGVFAACVLAMAGCKAEIAAHPGCDVDDDCAAGLYCGVGGCRADCRADRDCVAMGPAALCDARGRCGSGVDGGVDGGGTGACVDDSQCDDGVFCNGLEVCLPGASSADGRGCVRVASSCDIADCDEATDTCEPCRNPDADHDGYSSTRCGGPDCDDSNPLINPRAGEVCDLAGVDEDCAPATYGSPAEDQDADGFWPAATPTGTPCCNGAACGTDCADIPGVDRAARGRFPGATEVCNEVDDDCDGRIDEDVLAVFYRDADCDGFGLNIPVPLRRADGSLPPEVAAFARLGCPPTLAGPACVPGVTPGWVLDHTDCDDNRAATHPGATDLCNGIDDDCEAPTDPTTCACTGTSSDPVYVCGYSTAAWNRCAPIAGVCVGGAWNCPPGLITRAEPEVCNEIDVDENCNGSADNEALKVTLCADADGDGYGGVCAPHCAGTPGYIARGGDCCDSDGTAHPGATAYHEFARNVCGGYDYNCDGVETGQYVGVFTAACASELYTGACANSGGIVSGYSACGFTATWHFCNTVNCGDFGCECRDSPANLYTQMCR